MVNYKCSYYNTYKHYIRNLTLYIINYVCYIIYADDTTLILAVFEKLQLSTLELEQDCQKWGLKITPLKCG